MSNALTEDAIIFAYKQMALGRDYVDVYRDMTGNDEYPELGATILLGQVSEWYRKQTPQRLRELAGLPMMELGA